MTIEKTIGRTLAGEPKKIPETTAELLQLGFYLGPGCQTGFGVAKVITLMLLVGFAALLGALLLLTIAII
jgi:hypothetical protein